MKIIELHAENFMKLVAVTIKPDGALVQITGKNGQGKSSVLNAIWAALAGKAACPTEPIRKGAERALIRLNLGDITVTRTFHKKEGEETTTKLTVEKADGARYPSPQIMLDTLVDALGFDPLEFAGMKASDQFDALRRFLPDFDFDEYDNLRRGDFGRRTDVNRIAREKRAAAEAIVLPSIIPQAVAEETIIQAIADAGTANTELARRKDGREQAAQQLETLEVRATGHDNDAVRLKERMAQTQTSLGEEVERIKRDAEARMAEAVARCEASCDTLRSEIEGQEAFAKDVRDQAAELKLKLETAEALPEPVDVVALQASLAEGKKANAVLADVKRRGELMAEAVKAEDEAAVITARIEAREKEKEAKIAAVQMPVPGLSFGEREVLLNGLPFAQASDRERLVVSASIAMAANPKLRILRIRQGSQLDSDGLAILNDLIADKTDPTTGEVTEGYQAWIERVDESGKVGFVLEDGHLKEPEEGKLV